jgi:NAD(P)-dependent dehydrogenase (short-subunit alcohol dehydrogenase family)
VNLEEDAVQHEHLVNLPPQDLREQVAIVTGGGKGLGRAYALHLAARGARVLVNNRRHPGEADEHTSSAQTVRAIREAGGTAAPDWSDVSDPASGVAMVEAARTCFGRLDIVVANAGVDKGALFHKQPLDEFRRIFDTGFFGNLQLVHAAWPHFIAQNAGRVILTASSAGLYGNRGQGAYSAAKAAVIGLARALAQEGARHNVLVNVIAPYALTQMTSPYMDENIGRRFDAALVAPLVGWLASPACSLNGETLVCGAGIIRRAGSGESDAVAFRPEGVAQAVAALRPLQLNAYPSADASFARFLQELAAAGPA